MNWNEDFSEIVARAEKKVKGQEVGWKERVRDIVFDDLSDLAGNTNCQIVVNAINQVIETEIIENIFEEMGTHLPGEETGYCDTGEDIGLACRSECVEMAINRTAKWLGKESV